MVNGLRRVLISQRTWGRSFHRNCSRHFGFLIKWDKKSKINQLWPNPPNTDLKGRHFLSKFWRALFWRNFKLVLFAYKLNSLRDQVGQMKRGSIASLRVNIFLSIKREGGVNSWIRLSRWSGPSRYPWEASWLRDARHTRGLYSLYGCHSKSRKTIVRRSYDQPQVWN